MYKKFKTSIKSWITFKKVPRQIKFNENAWLKPYIEVNTNPRKKAKNDFKKQIFRLMNNAE